MLSMFTDFFRVLLVTFARRSFHLRHCFDCPHHRLLNHIYSFLNNSINLPHTNFTTYFIFIFSWGFFFLHRFYHLPLFRFLENLKWQVILQNKLTLLQLIIFSLLGWRSFVSLHSLLYVSCAIFSVSPVRMTFWCEKIPPAHPYSMWISITFSTQKYWCLCLSSLSSPVLPSLSSLLCFRTRIVSVE